jgi:transcription antitermination protein NusB
LPEKERDGLELSSLFLNQISVKIARIHMFLIQYVLIVDSIKESNSSNLFLNQKHNRLRQFRSNNLKRKIPIMKTSQDPRHKKRQIVVQELFGIEFHDQKIGPVAQKIMHQKTLIDNQIQKAAPDFPVSKINKIDLAILRLAVYELIIDKKAPQNVVIDEAVELAKEFGNETSPAFVNGVLGHILSYANVTKIQ